MKNTRWIKKYDTVDPEFEIRNMWVDLVRNSEFDINVLAQFLVPEVFTTEEN